MPTTPYTSVSAILTLQCATCGFYQKTTNPAIASLLAAKHQAGWGSAHAVTTTGASFLDFTTGILPPGVTFIRASIGTYNNSSNILATAGVNVARFNYVAGVANLLIEGSATNLLTQSNNFASADWVAGNAGVVTAAQFISPDGTNDGWSLTSGSGNAYVYEIFNFLNVPYTLSVWAKRIVGVAPLQLLMQDQSSGSLTTSTTIARFSFTATPAAAFTANYFQVIAGSGSTNGIFGGQFETGSKMTSYIPTTTAAATRAIDQATFTIPAGVTQLKYTFDDNSTQTVSVSPGSYTIPATLNRANIKTIDTISGSASINFDFTTGALPGAITFTRASIGTYNSSGNVLTTAGNNVARFNYVGGVANLLIEGSATNLAIWSNNFANWAVIGGAVISSAQFTSPDGTNNGWSMTSGSGNGGVEMFNGGTSLLGIPYTFSVWAKRIIGTAPIYFQLTAGAAAVTVATSATLTRLSVIITPVAGAFDAYILVFAGPGSTNGIYGTQVETGSIPTSYIPTTTTAVTRAADSAVFTIPAGINTLTYTFDDGSTQVVSVSPGSYTIPSNLNRPNIKSIVGSFVPPGVNFDFTSGVLPGAITFTRPSIGTYVNNAGTLITATSNVARFNYVGGVANLLIEPATTNMFTQSNNFTSAGDWFTNGGQVITAAQFVSPDGTNNGWSMTSGGTGSAYLYEIITTAAGPLTISFWVKTIVSSGKVQLGTANIAGSDFTPTTTLTRYSSSVSAPSPASAWAYLLTDVAPGLTIGIYGAQLEASSIPTSYIPTTTAAVTRAADSAVFTIPSGVGHLTYTFDDNSTQLVTVSAGSYTIPATLNRPNIKSIVGSA